MKIWKQTVLFYLGGMCYVGLELLWRGRSHGSMFLLGGACFVILGWLRRVVRAPALLRGLLGAAIITVLEFGTGLLVNRSYAVWDYRGQPENLMGQVCPLFSLLWIPVSIAAMELHRRLSIALARR